MRQRVQLQLDRVAEPDRVAAVVLDRIGGQRVDEHVKPLPVKHQPRHDMIELVGLEDEQDIGDRVRPARLVAKPVILDPELLLGRRAHPLGNAAGLRRIVIDVRVVAQVPYRFRGLLSHRASSLVARLMCHIVAQRRRFCLPDYAAILVASSRTRSADFSPIIIVAALVLPDTTVGMTEASATRRPSIPRTLSSGSTTAIASTPILQVLVGWNTVPPRRRAKSKRSSSLCTSGPGRNSDSRKGCMCGLARLRRHILRPATIVR